ncbi:ketose-bisphosphate aldolase [Halobacteroides halobius DSM 5150]|uniref:Ketose-bisphosphate aldolase n=1 Tax=Halobacteroides halobius (strain ATCC 35273 / DSM 5150 / MD-1) TaxID=748449 RepID=L0KAS1_HALHC|nr:class II fructose-bisphosphate aldolase [Halobacteroides halobius]AGB42382.1 ketose-bisphosphate aldolase [Halobacteroides halobius DSM 5150]
MLVNLRDMVDKAAKNNYAVAGFNVYGYEDATAVIKAAEEMDAPVILMANKDAVEHMPVEILANIFCPLAEEADVPVCVKLDHAKDYFLAVRAIKSGFTSVMYDGSQLLLKENIKNTQEIVKLAHSVGVAVEAEIGSVGYNDSTIEAEEIYTDPEEAKIFAEKTNVDALAVAVGTLHRMKKQGAEIQYDRLVEIEKLVDTPLVIHGSSGVTDEDLSKLATTQVGKVNIGTALRMAFGNTLKAEVEENPEEFDRIKWFKKPMEAVTEATKEKLRILGF